MRMRVTTERASENGSDPYGGGTEVETILDGEPAYWWAQSGREAISDDRSVVVADEHIIVARDADLKEGDRVVSVNDHEGREVLDRKRRVEYVAVERSHLDASVKAVTA